MAAHKYAQACFFAQQAGVKALSAVLCSSGFKPQRDSCVRVIQALPEDERSIFSKFIEAASALDKLHIPTRYPDALAGMTPAETYTQLDGEAAIASAQEILDCVEARIYRISNGDSAQS